ncbi:transposase family protein [Microbulbifer sp. VAAF005]|uniref:transposase family protein n=1 Tax=Microbulbifer sp. VAAF005 TaxID=3034230 RepID=UPI00333EBCBF
MINNVFLYKTDSVSLLYHFDNIEDSRTDRHKLHALPDISFIMFCDIICGAKTFRAFLISQNRSKTT